MALISVIVPVYNTEAYINQCVESILASSFTDFELILVDDGSTDGCPAICDAYATADQRVRVIHKTNGGQAEARNQALAIARGDFITFVDSDDWISPDYLNQLLGALERYQADISICGLKYFRDGREIAELSSGENISCREMRGREVCVGYYNMEWNIRVGPQEKLYRACLWKDIRFPAGKIYEDQGTIPKVVYLADKVVLMDQADLYAYRVRQGSTSHCDFSARKFEDVWNVEQCRRFFEEGAGKPDPELEKLSRRFGRILQAKYVVQAYGQGAGKLIPPEYRMSLAAALRLLRKEINDETYTWYLEQVHPGRVRPHAWMRKIKSMLRGKVQSKGRV